MPRSPEEFSESYEEQGVDLRGHDLEILSFLEAEELTHFTFDGLQRGLRLHPETLNRSLTRLEEEGFIQKEPEGYRTIKQPSNIHPAQLDAQRGTTVSIAQTLLPAAVSPRALLGQLRGRWFGRLRWLGHSARRDSLTLKWITEDGAIRLYAKLEGPLLTIQAAIERQSSLEEAVRVSHQLLGQLSVLYSRTPQARVATYLLYSPVTAAAL